MCTSRTTLRAGALILACSTFAASAQQPTSRPLKQPSLTDEQQRLVEKLVQACAEERRRVIQEQKGLIAELAKPVRGSGKEAAEARRQQPAKKRAAKERLKELQDQRKLFPPTLPRKTEEWRVGMVGILDRSKPIADIWRVDQVLSSDELLVHFHWNSGPLFNLPAGMSGESQTFWLKGHPTEGVVSGQKIDMNDVLLHIRETKTYPTAGGGSNTTFVLEVVDPVVIRAVETALQSARTKEKE